jgi:hypothetical protein
MGDSKNETPRPFGPRVLALFLVSVAVMVAVAVLVLVGRLLDAVSVVSTIRATEAAFSTADLVTLTGSTMPSAARLP